MTLIVAIFLFAYGCFFSFRASLPSMSKDHPTADKLTAVPGVSDGRWESEEAVRADGLITHAPASGARTVSDA